MVADSPFYSVHRYGISVTQQKGNCPLAEQLNACATITCKRSSIAVNMLLSKMHILRTPTIDT